MQALAQQFNLSETTFIFPSARVDAIVRIYTPAFEMPFAGHPTLGTAHVIRAITGRGALTLEMHAGDINVVATGPQQWRLQTAGSLVATPPIASIAQLAAMLQLPTDAIDPNASWINTGSDQLIIPVTSVAAVLGATPVPALLAQYGSSALRTEPIAYVWAWADAAQTQVVARTFFIAHGAVIEDPATGSACANLGGWLSHTGGAGNAPRNIEVRQGDGIGRPSTLHLTIDHAGAIFVSGDVIEVARGTFAL
jgi:trans-2,3-dihydro-3-hydroxyanthranilate isomerase